MSRGVERSESASTEILYIYIYRATGFCAVGMKPNTTTCEIAGDVVNKYAKIGMLNDCVYLRLPSATRFSINIIHTASDEKYIILFSLEVMSTHKEKINT